MSNLSSSGAAPGPAMVADDVDSPARGASGPPPPPRPLPEEPLFVIGPGRARGVFNLRELWAYRELLYFLTWRDIKVRYKQTALGAAWAVLQPVFMTLIFTLFFGRLAGVDSEGLPYPLFALAGLVPWTFFANTVTTSGNSVVNNANIITKVYFPRLMMPATSVLAGLVDLALASGVLACAVFYYGQRLTWRALFVLPLTALMVIFAVAVGTWLAAVNVKYRDVRFVLPFAMQVWLFASSVIVPSSAVPAQWRWLLALNPMASIVEGFRAALFGLPFDWPGLALAAGTAAALLVYAAFYFKRVEKGFADII